MRNVCKVNFLNYVTQTANENQRWHINNTDDYRSVHITNLISSDLIWPRFIRTECTVKQPISPSPWYNEMRWDDVFLYRTTTSLKVAYIMSSRSSADQVTNPTCLQVLFGLQDEERIASELACCSAIVILARFQEQKVRGWFYDRLAQDWSFLRRSYQANDGLGDGKDTENKNKDDEERYMG